MMKIHYRLSILALCVIFSLFPNVEFDGFNLITSEAVGEGALHAKNLVANSECQSFYNFVLEKENWI